MDWITVNEAAKLLGVPKDDIIGMIDGFAVESQVMELEVVAADIVKTAVKSPGDFRRMSIHLANRASELLIASRQLVQAAIELEEEVSSGKRNKKQCPAYSKKCRTDKGGSRYREARKTWDGTGQCD